MLKVRIPALSVKEVDGRRFYYADFGSETHGRTTFRLWVHHSLVAKDEEGNAYLEPGTEGRVFQGKHPKTKILRPSPERWIVVVYCPCGYRGSATITPTTPGVEAVKFWEYRSPRGNLGISEGAILVVPANHDAVTVHWERTGRLYGAEPEGTAIVHKDGRIEGVEATDLCEIEDLGAPTD